MIRDLLKQPYIYCVKVPKYGFSSGPYFPVFSSNAGKYEPEKTPHLDIFQALIEKNLFLCHVIVCHVLVNDAMRGGVVEKNDKYDIGERAGGGSKMLLCE